ncbi:MAG: hypothetical protein MJ159_06040 [Treponemataceae bacterium]|nr:hypothetical protein [Treponemataceae bacterium]
MSYSVSLIPSDVTVGERAQLVYRFESSFPFPLQNFNLLENSEILKKQNDSGNCTIFSLQFEANGSDCVLIMDLIPWKAGELSFLPFDFSIMQSKAAGQIDSEDLENAFIIEIPSVSVRSVTEETGVSVLQPPEPPLVIPGTTYTVYFCICASAVLCVLVSVFLLRFKQIRLWWQNFCIKTKRRRNARQFVRLLRAFLRAKKQFEEDIAGAEIISKEVRLYLERRFGLGFESAVTGELLNIAENEFEQCCLESLAEIQKVLVRCDELRFSDDEQKKKFTADERTSIAFALKTAVLHFEKRHETKELLPEVEDQNELSEDILPKAAENVPETQAAVSAIISVKELPLEENQSESIEENEK